MHLIMCPKIALETNTSARLYCWIYTVSKLFINNLAQTAFFKRVTVYVLIIVYDE